MLPVLSPSVRRALESAYPAVIGSRPEIIGAYVEAARLPHVTTTDALYQAVRIYLRNRIALAASEAERPTYRRSISLLNGFVLSGHTYAERVLHILAQGEGDSRS